MCVFQIYTKYRFYKYKKLVGQMKIAVIGLGNMGGAFVEGLLKNQILIKTMNYIYSINMKISALTIAPQE